MGQINLARIDDRLIHGQVMTKWSKGLGTNAVYVIDNQTAADDFMKDIYVSTNSTGGLKIRVYSDQEVADEWQKNQFGNDKAVLVFKHISEAKAARDAGLEFDSLNVGGVSKKPDSTFVIPTVALNAEDAQILRDLSAEGVTVYFQTVPDSKKVSLENGLKELK